MRQKNGQSELATQLLEKLIEEYPAEADLSAVNLLAELHMANGAFATTISWIDQARALYSADQPLPLDLSVKAGICHAYLGDLEAAEVACRGPVNVLEFFHVAFPLSVCFSSGAL